MFIFHFQQSASRVCKSAFVAIVLFTTSSHGLAHTRLVQSVPAAQAQLVQSPNDLQLSFADPVILAGLLLYKQQQQILLPFKPNPTLNKQFQIALPPLSKGIYTVQWKTLGADGHGMRGEYNFTIQ